MESALMFTSITVGGILVFPAIMEFLRGKIAYLLVAFTALWLLYTLSPFSPPIRAVWNGISQLPGQAGNTFSDSMAKMTSGYFNAFH